VRALQAFRRTALAPEQTLGAAPSPSRAREAALTAGAAALVALFCGLLLLWDPGFFWIDDYQSGALPGYAEMVRAWRAGEIPLLSRSSWWAGALGAEYPAGVFSPSLALSSLLAFGLGLTLPLTAAAISIIHLMILAAGTFRLARQRGLGADLALFVVVVTCLNGWILLWGARSWGVCLFSFAWLPWFWWALERARPARHGWTRFLPAGLFLALLITAGWPHTVLMAALVSAWVVLQEWLGKRRLLTLWPTPAAWVLGLALSAPAWLMFLEYTPHTYRMQGTQAPLFNPTWAVPLDSLPGLVLPNVVAHWWIFGVTKEHVAGELAGGLVPLVIVLPCVWLGGRAYLRAVRWDLALCALLLVAVTSPSLGRFQYSFRWLPPFFLALGLLGAESLAWLRRQGGAVPNLGKVALCLVGFVWVRTMISRIDPDGSVLASGVGLLLLAFLWREVEARCRPGSRLRAAAPAAVALASCGIGCVACAPYCEVPTWHIREQIRQPGALDPARRYLSVTAWNDVFDTDNRRLTERMRGIGEELYFANTAGYAGLDFVNGYSTLTQHGMHQLFPVECHGTFLDKADAERILLTETGPRGILQLMAVDGLIVSDRFAAYRGTLTANGWTEAARVRGGTVFHRVGAPSPRVRAVAKADVLADRFEAGRRLTSHGRGPAPAVLLAEAPAARTEHFAAARVALVEEGRHVAVADVAGTSGRGDVLVVFARPWFPGYEATCDGRPVPVEVFDLILPAVRLPAGTSGRVVLEYRPRSFVFGCRLAAAAALVVILCVLAAAGQRFLRRRTDSAGEGTCTGPRCRPAADRLTKEVAS
jgi:hypothetical protein